MSDVDEEAKCEDAIAFRRRRRNWGLVVVGQKKVGLGNNWIAGSPARNRNTLDSRFQSVSTQTQCRILDADIVMLAAKIMHQWRFS